MVTPWSTGTTKYEECDRPHPEKKCHDDFQTKRNENPATPEIGHPENRSLELECTTFHGHVEKSTLVQRTHEKLPFGTRR